MRWWLVALVLSGCASPGTVSRLPASQALSPGGLNEVEERECENYQCRYYIAPCALKNLSPLNRQPGAMGPERYVSLKQESYLKEFDALLSVGYTEFSSRTLPEENYARNTCIFVFKK